MAKQYNTPRGPIVNWTEEDQAILLSKLYPSLQVLRRMILAERAERVRFKVIELADDGEPMGAVYIAAQNKRQALRQYSDDLVMAGMREASRLRVEVAA